MCTDYKGDNNSVAYFCVQSWCLLPFGWLSNKMEHQLKWEFYSIANKKKCERELEINFPTFGDKELQMRGLD